MADSHIARDQLENSRQIFNLTVRLSADLQNLLPRLHGSRWDSHINLVHLVLLNSFRDHLTSTDDLNSIHEPSPGILIVVDNTDNLLLHLGRCLNVAQNEPARVTCSDQHNTGDMETGKRSHISIRRSGCSANSRAPYHTFESPRRNRYTRRHQHPEPIHKANQHDQEQLYDAADHMVGDGHTINRYSISQEETDSEDMHHAGDCGSNQDPRQLAEARIAPDGAVKPQKPEQ